ncbi:TetR family transcriptional regulator [Parvibaculum sedimenti]|uniref:TetR family transcriptional regulator n=1 Tax=Parvibaculum sedimenti TaxID=2608632 RepID=A0A6N6VF55_9HYPH|nr:TetR/AcrR family transcriptional regulator [Parvibaculum sedimenti]KAB7739409.1 TetR family transcriptional regulator [Parvibaculum sedimenti]
MGLEDYRRNVSEAKHASILQAGRAVFLRDGFSRAAVAEIARDADVSTATLYKHFASKEDLFAAIIMDAITQVEDLSDLEGTETALADILLTIGRTYLTNQFERGANDLMRIVIAETTTSPALAAETLHLLTERRRQRLVALFDRCVERGIMKPNNTDLSAQLLSGMIKELFVWPAIFDTSFTLPSDTEDKIRTIIQVFLARYAA